MTTTKPTLQPNQVHALASTLGHLEARIDIEEITGIAPLPGEAKTAAQLCYRAIATAFPEIEYLIEERYLGAVSEPCS